MVENTSTSNPGAQAEESKVATKVPTLNRYPTPPEERREHSRQIIAYAVIAGYLLLLLLNISIPFVVYWFSQPSDPQQTVPLTVSDIKDLTLAISSAMSGLVGVLGFIMGYYFKSAEGSIKKDEINNNQ